MDPTSARHPSISSFASAPMDDNIRRYNVERSCLRCHERKVRCNKGSLCNKCMRLGVPCQYSGPGRVKCRLPKTTVTDVVNSRKPSTQPANISSVAETHPSPFKDNSAHQVHRSMEGQPSHHGMLVNDGSYIEAEWYEHCEGCGMEFDPRKKHEH